MGRIKNKVMIISFLVVCLLLMGTLYFEKYFLQLSLLMISCVCIPFFVRFERKAMKAEEIILIAVLAAIAAVSRVPFASIPSVQPTSFVIIMTGLIFGSEVGFMVGGISALVSNMFLGQGPWTPWQLLCWGMMGLMAGLLRKTKFMKSLMGKCVFGGVWGFLFGWIMNAWYMIGFFETLSFEVMASAMASSFYFDLAHAFSNVFFILLFSKSWIKILSRVKLKYGILMESHSQGKID